MTDDVHAVGVPVGPAGPTAPVPVLDSEQEWYGCETCGADFAELAEMEDHVCPGEVAL